MVISSCLIDPTFHEGHLTKEHSCCYLPCIFWPWPVCSRPGSGGHGSYTLCAHALRHAVEEGLLEAAGERSSAVDGECPHGAGAGCPRVSGSGWGSTKKHYIPHHLLNLFLFVIVVFVCFFRPDTLGRIIGSLVLTNKKAQFVLTHKLLLLQYKYEVIQWAVVSQWMMCVRNIKDVFSVVSHVFASRLKPWELCWVTLLQRGIEEHFSFRFVHRPKMFK